MAGGPTQYVIKVSWPQPLIHEEIWCRHNDKSIRDQWMREVRSYIMSGEALIPYPTFTLGAPLETEPEFPEWGFLPPGASRIGPKDPSADTT